MSHQHSIIFCTYPSVYSSIVLMRLLASSDIRVAGIVCSTRKRFRQSSSLYNSWSYIRDCGLSYAFFLFLATDLFSWLQPLSKRASVNRLARDHRIPLLETDDINSAKAQHFLRSVNADMLFCAHFNQKIIPDLACFDSMKLYNLHPSLLPRNKGVDPGFYALLRKDSPTGCSIHVIERDFDSGQIYASVPLIPEPGESVLSLNCRLFDSGARLFLKVLEQPQPQSQPQHGEGNYDSWPSRKTVKAFRQSGGSLFHFREFWRLLQMPE